MNYDSSDPLELSRPNWTENPAELPKKPCDDFECPGFDWAVTSHLPNYTRNILHVYIQIHLTDKTNILCENSLQDK